MKTLISFIFLLSTISVFSQQEFKKKYTIPITIDYGDESDGIDDKHPLELMLKTKDKKDSDKKFKALSIYKKYQNSEELYGNVIFEKDTLFINPWLIKDDNNEYVHRKDIFYFKLKNRQSLKLDYTQWSFNAITIPLKVRFGKENEFSTKANLGGMIGFTNGTTNFVHRNKVGNKTYDTKSTVGFFLGFGDLEFKYTKKSETDKTSVKTAFLSTGIGWTYSYEKFTTGVFGGFDWGLDRESPNWDYHGHFWLGAGVGYSLFSF